MNERKPIIRIQNVSKVFNRTVKAVNDVTLDVLEGEFLLCWARPAAEKPPC